MRRCIFSLDEHHVIRRRLRRRRCCCRTSIKLRINISRRQNKRLLSEHKVLFCQAGQGERGVRDALDVVGDKITLSAKIVHPSLFLSLSLNHITATTDTDSIVTQLRWA